MKQLVKNYSFNKTSKTVTFTDFSSILLERVLVITDVTANVIVYQFNKPGLGGTVSGNVLTLAYDTSGLNNADKLQIFYDAATGDPGYDSSLTNGGIYTSADPNYSNGQRGAARIDSFGRLMTTSAPLSTGIDSVSVGGIVATGSPVPAAAVYVGIRGASGNLQSPSTAGNSGDSNVNLDAVLAVATYAHNGSNSDLLRTPTVFKTASATAAGDTAAWTPASGKKFRLMQFKIMITGNATQSASGVLSVSLRDNTTDLGLTHDVYIMNTAMANQFNYDSGWITLGNGRLSAAANNVLNVNLSNALTAGNIRVIVSGTEE